MEGAEGCPDTPAGPIAKAKSGERVGAPAVTVTMETLPKAAKALPPEAQRLFVDTYNRDFGWRCSESHAEKAAWRAVYAQFPNVKAETTKAK